MSNQTTDLSDMQRGDELLTTGEAAHVVNASRQHIVDLCERGDLPFIMVGRHRRVRRAHLDALMSRTTRMTRDQLRSLWLGHATACKVVEDPVLALEKARQNVELMREIHPRAGVRRWLDEWDELLRGPVEGVLDALTSRTPHARELRQTSPFAGLVSEAERQRVLSAFNETHPRRGREAS